MDKTIKPRFLRLLASAAIGLAAALLWLALLAPPPALLAAPQPSRRAQPVSAGRTFTVTSPSDVSDLHPGDGVCETGAGNKVCTLRAAVQEVDQGPGGDTIVLPPALYLLTQAGAINPNYDGNLDISRTVTILGAGPDRTIIDGNSSVTGERVFDILTGTVVISGVTIQNGRGYNEGGNILNDGLLTIVNSHILSGTADGLNDFGGGIATGGPLTVTHSLVRGNKTGPQNSHGGGLMAFGIYPMLVIDSLISDNVTSGTLGFGLGGGVAGAARIVNSTLSGNTARQGGGAYLAGNSVVINSTIAGNNATGAGGGLFVFGGSANLYNVTVAGNLANSDLTGSGNGGGVAVQSGTFDFINTILSGNNQIVTPGPFLFADNCAGTVNASGFDILGDNDNPFPHCTVNGSPSNANPLLGPLADNGGPTPTLALLPGSPAIDAGNSSGCTDDVGAPLATDQRGRPRTANGAGLTRCDIGAYEAQRVVNLPLVRR